MSADQHLQTVGEIYAAFGRGDVPAILSNMADDVAWESWSDNRAQAAGVPWLAERQGPGGVAEFFQIAGSWEIRSFEVKDMLASDSQVAVEVEIDAILPGGAPLHDQELHLWTLGTDGKVTRMRHYTDTAKHLAAAGIAVAAA